MKVAIIGAGHVGLVSGACFAEAGHDITCIDSDEEKISVLNDGSIPFFEPDLGDLVAKNVRDGRLRFTTSLAEGMEKAAIIAIAVGTPALLDGRSDLSFLRRCAADIGRTLSGDYTVIATMSTVPVGTGEDIERIIREESRGVGDYDIVSNPEFLREGSAVRDRLKPNRVVIGAETERAAERMRELYRYADTKIYTVGRRTAEMSKYACNAFLATKISFINEIANLCDHIGADVSEIAQIMGDDSRIGPDFLQAGLGYGGSCFPKDTRALDHIAHHQGHYFNLLKAVIEVNNQQVERFLDKIESQLGDLRGRRVAVLGLTFKPGTDDVRESPALPLIERLTTEGVLIKAHDPKGGANAQAALHEIPSVIVVDSPEEAASGADALILVTDWPEYRDLDWGRIKKAMPGRYVFDGRNFLPADLLEEQGFKYFGIGRSSLARDASPGILTSKG